MTRAIPLCLALVAGALPASGDGLGVEALGLPFVPKNISLSWRATNRLPETAAVFRVVPTNYPAAFVACLMQMASFTDMDKAAPFGDGVFKDPSVRYFRSADQSRYLGILPAQGWILYKNAKAIGTPKEQIEGVPDTSRAVQLARQLFGKLGLNEQDLACRSGSRDPEYTEAVRERTRRAAGNASPGKEVVGRYLFFKRRLNGATCAGPGVSGGIWIGFGNRETISDLEIVWRQVERLREIPLPSRDDVEARIRRGQAAIRFDTPEAITELVVTNASLHYLEQPGRVRQTTIVPYLALDREARCAGTNRAAILCVPVHDTR